MTLNAPKTIVFWISVALAGLGILGKFVAISGISANAFLLVAAGFILLAAGNVLKGV